MHLAALPAGGDTPILPRPREWGQPARAGPIRFPRAHARVVRVDCPLKDQSYRTCRGRWGQSCSPTLTWPSCRHVPTAARFLVEASCPAVPRRGCWIIRVGRGFVSGIVEGGVGDAGARATDGVGRGVCFRRPSWRWRACADDGGRPPSGGFHLIGKVPPDR